MYPKAIINIITINSFIINVLISSEKSHTKQFHAEETHYCSCWSIQNLNI